MDITVIGVNFQTILTLHGWKESHHYLKRTEIPVNHAGKDYIFQKR